jgi:cytochrome c-type biogenesis protein CcmH/NrfG
LALKIEIQGENMGVHKRDREIEDLKENYIKKSSCIMFVLLALLAGAFVGNTITMLYLGQQGQGVSSAVSQSGPVDVPHVANPVALAQLEEEAAANPTNAEGWIKLGNFCFDHELFQKAVNAYERSLELSPMNINVWSDLGVMYRRTKQFDKAVNAFEQAADLDPKHITSRFNMGIVYLHDLNDKVGALKAWKQVLVINPNAVTPTGQKVSELVNELDK